MYCMYSNSIFCLRKIGQLMLNLIIPMPFWVNPRNQIKKFGCFQDNHFPLYFVFCAWMPVAAKLRPESQNDWENNYQGSETSCKFLRLVTQSFFGLFLVFWAFLYHKLWAIFHSSTSGTWNWKKMFKKLVLKKD